MAYTNDLIVDCLQFERAFCTAKCPFNLDIIDFINKIQQGRFNVAYKTYQQAVGFPGIVSELCDEPCKSVCPMKDSGGAISLKLLEKASLEFARNKLPDQFNMPLKEKQIAVIGAGISGLACSLRLATKKYRVTVFEKSDRIGGHLHTLSSIDTFLNDIELQFMHESYTLHLNTEISRLNELDFDAVYVATGKGGNNFDLIYNEEGAFATNKQAVFMGGSISGVDTMHAIAHGLNASNAIERYLKIGLMNQPTDTIGTKLPYNVIRIKPNETVLPQNESSYSKEEAVSESNRCLKCACDACNHFSPLMNYFQKFPKRITEEVEVSIHPSSLDGNATLATRLISTCLHCGLCKEVCPVDIDTGEFLLDSHRTMHELGKMPWAFHEFYLRDMEFANSDAALTKLPKGFNTARYVFFPGCQLGASDPRLVIQSYQFLTKQFPDTALMLKCCGAPADWAGNQSIHNIVIDKIKKDWMMLGKPIAIFACPMCKQMFQKYLPEIEAQFLYTFIEICQDSLYPLHQDEIASVFDPCAARNETDLQNTIRNLAKNAGFKLEALPMEKNMAECCSYGGQVDIAHPPYANHIVQNRIQMNDHSYITYCSNCRDIFEKQSKKTYHILDIIWGINNGNRMPPTVSERQKNRLNLKYQALQLFWNEYEIMENKEKLKISKDLKEKLNKEYILESDLLKVIENCEQSGRKLYNPETESFTGYKTIGNMTYWVEYKLLQDDRIELVNGYCHRMKIIEK